MLVVDGRGDENLSHPLFGKCVGYSFDVLFECIDRIPFAAFGIIGSLDERVEIAAYIIHSRAQGHDGGVV